MSFIANVRSIAELMRVANVFTAISNVWMGMILATGGLPGWVAVGISTASALLYLGGMVLNDVFDHKLDATERPERPIPSGRVSLDAARSLGWGLLIAGVFAGWATSIFTATFAPGVVATILAGAIIAYDGGLKKTAGGPMAMAVCRAFNVLLGMSVGAASVGGSGYHYSMLDFSPVPALGIALYVLGVTWFARSEAGTSSRLLLSLSALVAMTGLAFIAGMPTMAFPNDPPLRLQPFGWTILWVVVGGSILRRMVVAILQPQPKYVQRAVGNAILSLIMIDAAICLGYAEPYWACAVLALLAPAMLLAQFLKVT